MSGYREYGSSAQEILDESIGAGPGGSGGVTVDNTVDPPAAITSIVAAGAVIAGDEATLPLPVFSRTTPLTDAQIKALPANSIELVPAPGDGKVIALIGALLQCDTTGGFYDWVTGTEEEAVAQIYLSVGGSPVSVGFRADTTLGTLFGSEDDVSGWDVPYVDLRFTTTLIKTQIPQSTLDVVDQPLELNGSNGGPDTNVPFTGGDPANFLSVTVLYAIVDVA